MAISRLWIGLTLIAAVTACSSDSGSSPPVQGLIDSDVFVPAADTEAPPGEDTETPPGDDITERPDTGPTGPNELVYSFTPPGGTACVGSCSITLDAGASVELAVRLVTAGGVGVSDTGIRWSTDAAGLKLASATSYTGQDGVASVSVTGLAAESNAIVRAQVDGDTTIADLPFSITVEQAGPPAAEVTVNYVGPQGVAAFELRVFALAGKGLTCESVHPDAEAPPQPDAVLPGFLPGKATGVAVLPGLVEGAEAQSYLFQVIGPTGVAKASGCVEVTAAFGTTEVVSIDAFDLALRFLGVTDITTNMDLYTGLPGTAGKALGFIIGLFDSPGATAIDAACTNPSSALSSLCPVLQGSDSIKQAADEAFYGLIKQFIDEDIIFAGDAIASLLKTLRLKSTLEVYSEASIPSNGGLAFQESALVETWLYAQYAWKFGKACDPLDDDCGWEVVKLADVFGTSPVAAPAGSVEDGNALFIEQHAVLGFDYGALINYLVEKRVLPSLFGDGVETIEDPEGYCDGMVSNKADTYEEVIAMIFGDECCTLFDDCCEFFLQKDAVYAYTGDSAFLQTIASTACELLISEGGSFIRKGVEGLGGDLQIGTASPCPAVDLDGDRGVDGLGSAAAPCSWDANVDFNGPLFSPDNTFTGKHK